MKTDDGEQENKRMENLGFRIGGASPTLPGMTFFNRSLRSGRDDGEWIPACAEMTIIKKIPRLCLE